MSLVQPKDSATQGASLARGRKAPEGMKEEWACGCVCVCFGRCGGQGLGKGQVTKPQGNTGNTQHLAATHLGLSWPHLTTRHLRADQGDGLPLRSWATRSILVLCPRWPLTAASLHPSPDSGVYFGVLQGPGLWAHRCQEPQPRAPTELALIENTLEKYMETYFQGSLFPNGV